MNLKTTLFLLVLLVGGAAGWYVMTARVPNAAGSPTLEFLDQQLTPERLTRIEIVRPGRPAVVLERTGDEWMLPGKWPVRTSEVDELVRTLTTLDSRFTPNDVGKETDLAKFGLGDRALTVKATVDGKVVGMKFGEEETDRNRFARATYLKLDDANEIVRLGPGIVAELDRPIEHFQQRRLFPVVRVPKDKGAAEKVDQVVAEEIHVKGPEIDATLTKTDDGWRLESPVKDRADPEKARALLTGLLDLWADKFVSGKDKTLEEMGLAEPEYVVSVKRPGGNVATVQIGKVSSSKDRLITKPAPPPASPFMPPGKPTVQIVKEEYRYAKLPDNDQIFEVKTDSLKNIAPPLDDLRDDRVARFEADDVRSLEIDWKGKTISLVKKDSRWRLTQPSEIDAERQPVAELLDKLAGLEAKGADVRDREDPKAVGLDAPVARVKIGLGGKDDGANKAGKDETITFLFGQDGKNGGAKDDKVFVKVAGWPRVNAVAADILKLLERDPLAYRKRRLIDQSAADVARVEIRRGGEPFVFERKDGTWTQTAPTPAKLDATKVDQLAGDLARLEAAEFLAATPSPEELDKYGLAKPDVLATVTFKDAKLPAETIALGKPRPEKEEWFARLNDGPVFAVKKEIQAALDRGSLAYRPAQAWKLQPDLIERIRVAREGETFEVTRGKSGWRISGPFAAPARDEYVDAIADELSRLKSETYVAQVKNDLAKFGLDKPRLTIEVASADKADGKTDAKKPAGETTATLEIGAIDPATKGRFARIGGGDAVFVVDGKTLAVLDRGPLDLLDRVLARVDVGDVNQIRVQGPAPFTLERKGNVWSVVNSPAPTFRAEDDAVVKTVRPWENLLAERIAAYGSKIDWAKFGLEKPETVVVVAAQDDAKKPIERTLSLGKSTEGGRFVRIDQQPAVAVLDAATANALAPSYLDFLDPRVLKFAFDAVTRIDRTMKDGDVEIEKRDDAWQMTKPTKQTADALTVDATLEKLFRLKAERIAAYPAKDLAKFGLASPVAVVTIHLGDDARHVVKIGDKADGDARFAVIDDGAAVIVLPAALSRQLTAPTLAFADRNLASFGSADRLVLRRGDRRVVFARSGTTWNVVEPVKADAEASLADFVQGLFRLRADEIVAGKDADPKLFGLSPPTLEWKVFSGDKELLDLQVGGVDKSGRRYGRLGGGEQVFVLTPAQSGQVMAEHRLRKPWPALDAAQISQVAVSRDGGDFTLVKRDSDWFLKEANVRADDKTVTSLLDALAGLKVDHYVADTKGNLPLYGLEPPEMTIELTTPTGSRRLLIGREEGGTRRRYAAVAGIDAVFVVGEVDAAKLLRPATEYREK